MEEQLIATTYATILEIEDRLADHDGILDSPELYELYLDLLYYEHCLEAFV